LEKTLEICAGLTVEKKKFRLMHWSLVAKLMLVGIPFMLLVLLATGATLWVSWQLDGGAAAVNEAGRMRMQSYRLALSIGTQDQAPLQTLITDFNQSLSTLKHGDPERPLFVPWDDNIRARFAKVEADWHDFQQRWMNPTLPPFQELHGDTVRFATDIDAFVLGIESHIARWTALLHLLQLSMLALVVVAAVILLYTGYLFVLEPWGSSSRPSKKFRPATFRHVLRTSSDEFGTLADGFNGMAEHLQSMYKNLEAKVAEKTAELQDKTERLASLYEVTALVANATSLETLAQQFVQHVARVARADGGRFALVGSGQPAPPDACSAWAAAVHGGCRAMHLHRRLPLRQQREGSGH
jgi:two-component system nitrate/nitrite sensor histidine kinase NarX